MAANNYHKYDEDFKKSLVSLHQNGKTQSQLCKGMACHSLLSPNGSNNTPPLKSPMVKSLLPNKSKNSKNEMHNWKRKTLS